MGDAGGMEDPGGATGLEDPSGDGGTKDPGEVARITSHGRAGGMSCHGRDLWSPLQVVEMYEGYFWDGGEHRQSLWVRYVLCRIWGRNGWNGHRVCGAASCASPTASRESVIHKAYSM